MDYLHNKISICMNKIIGKCTFTPIESSLKNAVKGLDVIYNKDGISTYYLLSIRAFLNYVKEFKNYAADSCEWYELQKLYNLANNMPTKFTLGSRVKHIRRCGYVPNTEDELTYSKDAIVDDYDYTVNQYQLKYDNGSIVGWVPESDINKI